MADSPKTTFSRRGFLKGAGVTAATTVIESANALARETKDALHSDRAVGPGSVPVKLHINGKEINHHGKRADAIVKGMLQHSRTSTGVKEPTDINALADEYLRLSYHGMRAKDKSFNSEIETRFDPVLQKINIIPQDIGRVLLNIHNNAFYAVHEKQKQLGDSFKPMVSVTTQFNSDSDGTTPQVEIRIRDNGMGIPKKVIDKIFQPFFTTKPTGEGTGLGLSLSYDIVTKIHSGELKVESEEGKGTEIVITLPFIE
jgi:signal transduction histidine kinase